MNQRSADLRTLADGAAAAWADAPECLKPILRDCADALTAAAGEIERLRDENAALRPTGNSAVFDDYCESVRLLHRFADGRANLSDRVAAALDENASLRDELKRRADLEPNGHVTYIDLRKAGVVR